MKKKLRTLLAGIGAGLIAVPSILGTTTEAAPEVYTINIKEKNIDEPDEKLTTVTDVGEINEDKWEFEAETDGITVKATASKDAFEDGTSMEVRRLNGEETVAFIDEINSSSGGDYTTAVAADVTFKDAAGNEVEPKSKVDVSFVNEELIGQPSPEMAHIKKSGEVEILEATYSDGIKSADFTLDEFSPIGWIDNPGNKDTLTMRGSDMLISMKLVVTDWETGDVLTRFVSNQFTEGQIHSSRDGDKLYCGNCFNDFHTGVFTAHDGREYLSDVSINKLGFAQFVLDNTPEYTSADANTQYFISQGFVWAMTSEEYFPGDVGSGKTMSVEFPSDTNAQRVWNACFGNFKKAVDSNNWGNISQGDATFSFNGKTYKWNGANVTAYVNEAYGFNKTKQHEGTCQSALQIQYDIDESGKVDLIKSSSDTSVTDGNSCYSLEGAEFTLTKTDDASVVYKLTTGSDGKAHLSEVLAGTYRVEETKTPKGFMKNTNIPNVTVEPGKTATITVIDEPIGDPIGLMLHKTDRKTGKEIPQGDASLAGAEFTIDFYGQYFENDVIPANASPLRAWVFKTDSSGKIYTRNPAYKIEGSDLFSISGAPTFPLGTFRIRETKAPAGYLVNPTVWMGRVEPDANGFGHIVMKDTTDLLKIGQEYALIEDEVSGTAKVLKIDADTKRSEAQGDANLSEIAFDLYNRSKASVTYKDKEYAVGAKMDTLLTKQLPDGKYTVLTDSLPYGTYELKETLEGTTNTSYVTKEQSQTFKIRENGEEVPLTFTNPVDKGTGKVLKVDADTKRSEPQGDATLDNITFDLFNRSAASIVYKGKEYAPGSKIDTLTTKKVGNEYTVLTDKLPYGTYEAKETKAGSNKSYIIREQSQTFQIRKDGEQKELKFENPVVKGKIKAVKLDADTGESFAQGDADFTGIQFVVFNGSAHSIVYEGKEYKPSDSESFTTLTLKKDSNGEYSATTGDLPYGTYYIQEVKTTDGYRLTDGKKHKVQVRENGKTYTTEFTNEVVRGRIDMTKFDLELNKSESLGAATLEDIHFNVVNRSQKYIMYKPSNPDELKKVNADFEKKTATKTGLYKFEPGEVIDVLVTKWDDDAKKYHSETGELPYGTYSLTETKTNKFYLLTPETIEPVQIREDKTTVERIKHNWVKRGEIDFIKIADRTSKRMSVPFKVSLYRTKEDREAGENPMEIHVVVTDENGMFNSLIYPHSEETNANDVLLDKENIKTSDFNTESGTWFSKGEFGSDAPVNDDLGAFPYGYYTLEEMPCDSNAGYELQKFDFSVYADRSVIPSVHLGTITDDEITPEIGTKAFGISGTQLVSAATDKATVTDIVGYKNFKPETGYLLKTWAVKKSTGEKVSGTVETPFKTEDSAFGEVTASLDIDISKCRGEDIVVFEEAYSEDGKTLIAAHKDVNDEGQTLHIPNMGTQASGEDGLKTLRFFEKTIIVDKVSYTNLEPNTEYLLKTWYVDKADGKKITKVVTTKYTTGDSRDGEAQAMVIVDTTAIRGKALVAYEEWYSADGSTLIMEHKDIDDEGQTVYVPELKTKATNTVDGGKLLVVADSVEIKDVVDYIKLEPNTEYLYKTWAVRKSDGAVVSDVVETRAKTGSERDGSAETIIKINTRDLKGSDIVVFEEVYSEDGKTLIAAHKDINAAGQTVHIPDMGTKATGLNGSKTVAVSETAEITDEIGYTNLEPNTEYLLKTWEVKRSDGSQVSEAVETKYTTGKERDGVATAKITVNTTTLKGEDLVTFEEWYSADGKTLIMEHKDLGDEGQTVHVPDMGTTATNTNGEKTLAIGEKVEINDAVAYVNIDPSNKYLLKTWAVKKSDGEVVSDVIETKLEDIEAMKGTVVATIPVDTSKLEGEDIVIFEEWYTEDGSILIVDHKDLNDEGQTVTVEKIPETPPAKVNTPKTGDRNNIGIYVVIAGAAGAVAVITGVLARKKKESHDTDDAA